MTVIVTNPHCGLRLTDSVRRNMKAEFDGLSRDKLVLDQSDLGADYIYDVPGMDGITELRGDYSRLVVDLNRPLSQAFPLNDLDGRNLYPDEFRITPDDFLERRSIWDSYHSNIKQTAKSDEESIIIDAHTMKDRHGRPDICIGTGGGHSCNSDFTVYLFSNIYHLFKNLNGKDSLAIATNIPYRDGFITKKYCDRLKKQGVSLEINRSLLSDRGVLNNEKMKDINYRFRQLAQRVAEYSPRSNFYLL